MIARAAWSGPSLGRLAVIGVGQIGGSLALAARASGAVSEVVGFSRSAQTLRRARELGIIDRSASSAAEAALGAGLVVLATPVRSLGAIAAQLTPVVGRDALVIDVGSVKVPAVRALESALPRGMYVACHPVAGTERAGPDAAVATLFESRPCVVCPTPATSAAALATITRLWTALGAEVVTMDADVHDRVLGACSHLPHVAAYALMAAVAGSEPAVLGQIGRLMTTSLRDTTRVAASSAVMWRDIFLDNRGEMLPLIDRLLSEIQALRAAIADDDGPGLEARLAAARLQRDRLISG